MSNKIKQYALIAFSYAYRLRDVRFAGQVLFVIIVLLVSWNGVQAIDTNYLLQRQIAQLQQQDDIQQLENNNLKLKNQYYNSDQYLELSARQNFGLAASGEKELVVPEGVALSYIASEPNPPTPKAIAAPSHYQHNLGAWLNFFLHRPQPID